MKKPTPASIYLSTRRSLQAIKDLQDKNKKNRSNFSIIPYDSLLITYWYQNAHFDPYVKVKKNKLTLLIPENFSIIENPKVSLEIIYQLVAIARSNKKIHYINCDHSRLTRHDLAAEALLGLITREFEKEYISRNRKLKISGILPKDDYLTTYISAIGVIRDLDVTHNLLSDDRAGKLKIINKRSNYYHNKTTSGAADYNEYTAKKFVDFINECLEKIGKELTLEAIDLLSEYTGEIINNASEHGGLKDWTIRGYLDEIGEERICEITIFNFGKTISDTFLELPLDSYAFQSVKLYIESHHKSGYFSPAWTKETLITLAALQGDISSKNKNEFCDRGQGTVDMINFFQNIHNECTKHNSPNAKMVLLSGSTHIYFDGTYKMNDDHDGRKVIAFNKQNSLDYPPDSAYVKKLDGVNFPGTIISIKFSLEDTNLKDV